MQADGPPMVRPAEVLREACNTVEHTLDLFRSVANLANRIAASDQTSEWLKRQTWDAEERLHRMREWRSVRPVLPTAPQAMSTTLDVMQVPMRVDPDSGEQQRHPVSGTPSAGDSTDLPLTAREREVAILIARGFSNQRIADALVVVPGTAANHVAHILRKLNCANRAQVAAWAVRNGLLADHPG
jgi:DNA-binding CsgD family transcriptional regulator